MTKKDRLVALMKAHPNWTTKRLAEELGQHHRIVAVTISKLRNPEKYTYRKKKKIYIPTGNPRGRPRKDDQPEIKRVVKNRKPEFQVFSKCGSTRSGYLQLM